MGSSKKSSDRDKRKRSRSRERERGRDRNRSRERDTGREGGKERSRTKHKEHHSSSSRKEKEATEARKKESSSHRSSRTHDEDDSRRRQRDKEEQRPSSKKDRTSHNRRKRSHSGGSQHSGSDETVKRKRSEEEEEKERSPPPVEKKSDANTNTQESSATSEPPPVVTSSGGGDAGTLSVEQTNELRASLGMKPLSIGTRGDTEKPSTLPEDVAPAEEEVETATKKEDVHAPPQNIGATKAAEKMKQRIETVRETRRVTKNLTSIRTLGEGDDKKGTSEIDDASNWVEKMRQLQKEKEAAQKREALLAEMDEEFGIADLVSDELLKKKEQAYSSRHLHGLTVEHKTDAIKEGKQVVLTLKDTKILDDADDVLVNVNIVDDEKASKNVELRKGKPSYNPYDAEEEVDQWGNLNKQDILKKYDEEIEGVKKQSFALGSQGDVDTSGERERELVRERLQAKAVSLELAPALAATEYYTTEEMVQFKRPKKRRKIRKKEQLKADDIIPLPEELTDTSLRDHGSRHTPKAAAKTSEEAMAIEPSPDSDWNEADLKDKDDISVDTALVRARRLLKRGNAEVSGAAKVVSMIESAPKMETESSELQGGEADSDLIVLDTTSEFCRQVGDDYSSSLEPVSTAPNQDGSDDEMELEEAGDGEDVGGWMEIHHSTREKKPAPKADDLYQEAEPLVASGIIAALEMATRKGFIETSKEKKGAMGGGSSRDHSDAKRDVEYERQKEKEREREVTRFDRDANFPEIRGYQPRVNIEYVDDKGRGLSVKEAFRFLSHKFHGRGSGKKKTERRLKKFQNEQFMKRSNSGDTPLNTLTMLQTKQKASQSPYILLSGGAQSLMAPDLAKKK